MIDSNINYIKYLTIAIMAIYLICNKSFSQSISGPEKPSSSYGKIYKMNEHPAFVRLEILNAKRSSSERLQLLVEKRDQIISSPMTSNSKIKLEKIQNEIYLNNKYSQALSYREYIFIHRNNSKAY